MHIDAWGITSGYEDALGVWRLTPPYTRRAVRAAMHADPADPPVTEPPPVAVMVPGARSSLRARGELALEDGPVITVDGRLPLDLPLGYHRLHHGDTPATTLVIVAPEGCPVPPGSAWGWATQLYAARTRASWGIGDLADLERFGRWSAGLGASLVLVNPLVAPLPVLPQEPSPYRPSSRRFRSLLYVRIEDVPGAREAAGDLEPLARAGHALNADRRIDRDEVYRLKLSALERLWPRFGGDDAFDAYCRAQGRALLDFATFTALAEHHGSGWSRWPVEHQRPDAGGVEGFRAAHADRVRFHQWVQWLADEQLARAGRACPVMQDLPIGFDGDGADAWAWQDVLALDVNVGAPPDRFNAAGQDWGLPPFVPHRLRAAGHAPFIETIRAVLRHAGGVRIDHVMGLFRLFWIPAGLAPSEGVYVRYAADELLAIVALECARAGAFAVGEDLGTVEKGVRETLARHGVLSYRCLWFEEDPPAQYPQRSLGSVTTHDLPTIAGLWTGSDVAAQQKLGLGPNVEGLRRIRERLARFIGVDEDAPAETVIVGAHDLLAGAGSAIVTATLEDALAVPERPNMPGTVDQWPNWSLALPEPLETVEQSPLPRAIARALSARSTTRPGGDTPRAARGERGASASRPASKEWSP
jgi:4-alpha-glucanotransferase